MIVVTGAGGNVGGALVTDLKARGAKFTAAYHSKEKATAAAKNGIKTAIIDFGNHQSLDTAFEGADALFLVASGAFGQFEAETAAIDAAVGSGVRKIVKLSVIGAQDADFSFARVHRPIEDYLKSADIAWTMLQPNGFMQNFSVFMREAINAGTLYEPMADARVSYVDLKDVARVAAEALTDSAHDGKSYTLTGPRSLGVGDACEVLSQVVGHTVTYQAIDEGAARAGMIGYGMPETYADLMLELYRFYREGGGEAVKDDIFKVTGADPTDFRTFAAREFT